MVSSLVDFMYEAVLILPKTSMTPFSLDLINLISIPWNVSAQDFKSGNHDSNEKSAHRDPEYTSTVYKACLRLLSVVPTFELSTEVSYSISFVFQDNPFFWCYL